MKNKRVLPEGYTVTTSLNKAIISTTMWDARVWLNGKFICQVPYCSESKIEMRQAAMRMAWEDFELNSVEPKMA